jgi:hypothetical protein
VKDTPHFFSKLISDSPCIEGENTPNCYVVMGFKMNHPKFITKTMIKKIQENNIVKDRESLEKQGRSNL